MYAVKTFNTKIGVEFLVPLLLILGYLLYELMIKFSISGLLILLLLFSFFAYIFLSTKYIIRDKTLEVKCGFFLNQLINIDTIQKVKDVTDLFAAPATSIFRIEIKYNDNESIVISPKNKHDFIQLLLNINPRIEIEKSK